MQHILSAAISRMSLRRSLGIYRLPAGQDFQRQRVDSSGRPDPWQDDSWNTFRRRWSAAMQTALGSLRPSRSGSVAIDFPLGGFVLVVDDLILPIRCDMGARQVS